MCHFLQNRFPDLFKHLLNLILLCLLTYFCSSCQEEETMTLSETAITTDGIDPLTLTEQIENVEETLSDEELLQLLDEEIAMMEAGRVVDITGMEVPKGNPKKVYVHYMPWFQSLDYDGYWGQHWTMTNRNPDRIDTNGQREIASFYYPLIGPYSSNDPDLHEYHFLLMKMAGIDGVIFDWYGSRDIYDYQLIRNATDSFIAVIEDLGLDFSIMYEDRVAVQSYEAGLSGSTIEAAQEDLLHIHDHYFSSERYINWENKNSLFVFGPHHITTSAEWNEIFEVIPVEEKPDFLTLWAAQHQVGGCAAGEFLWIAPDHLDAHEHYYSVYPKFNSVTVGSVYPGFESYYSTGGWSDGINDWVIDHHDGNTFVETLNYTHHEVADFIQIATWNDFGEGTMIEPTEEYGFMYLQLLQQYTQVTFTSEDLQVVLELYNYRKKYKDHARAQRILDRVYEYVKSLDMRKVKRLLKAIDLRYS